MDWREPKVGERAARSSCLFRLCVWSLQACERLLRERLGLLLSRGVRICAAEADADEAAALQDVERAAHATVDPVGIVADARDVRGRCAAFLFLAALTALFVFVLVLNFITPALTLAFCGRAREILFPEFARAGLAAGRGLREFEADRLGEGRRRIEALRDGE